jgi:acyl-CoA reductase-like NAD-dependent aldehyde dehydrogenase
MWITWMLHPKRELFDILFGRQPKCISGCELLHAAPRKYVETKMPEIRDAEDRRLIVEAAAECMQDEDGALGAMDTKFLGELISKIREICQQKLKEHRYFMREGGKMMGCFSATQYDVHGFV